MLRPFLCFYSLAYTLALAGYLPLYLYRMLFEDKRLRDLVERVRGPRQQTGLAGEREQGGLWFHAVSVGEVKAVEPLLQELSQDGVPLYLSTITATGQQLARRMVGGKARIFYFPLDWQWLCRRYLRCLRPRAIVLVETEIWPGFLGAAAHLGIPVLLVNGRLSDRSFRRYRRARFFVSRLLGTVDHFCVQSRRDKERLLELGVPPDRVNQMGNLKYDYSLAENPEMASLVDRVAALLKPETGDLLWICGSTREGEEALLLDVFETLRRDFPRLRLLLAPRHPHRAEEIGRLLKSRRLSSLCRSQMSGPQPAPQVLLLDTIGELAHLYRLADVVFVGGSLVARGGHNVIEAAYFGKPILFGPHMENFREVSSRFLNAYAALQVRSAGELATRLRDLLGDREARRWLGRNARKVVRESRGAVARTAEVLRRRLDRTP